MDVIEIRNLGKRYGKQSGIEDVSFSVKEGELFGFVGPNGAGKSTTIKILLHFISPTRGSASICGRDVTKDGKAIKQFTSYVPSNVRFYEDMTVEALIRAALSFYPREDAGEAKRLCGLFDLDQKKRFYELSMGNRKKAAIVCAMATRPKLLLLDEPTNGLDPMMQKRLFTELKEQKKAGMTILLSSHNLGEVQEYCDRTAFIRKGRIVAVTDLKKEASPGKRITLWGGRDILPPGAALLEREDEKRIFRYDGDPSRLPSLLAEWAPLDLTIENESLEDRFMSLYDTKEKGAGDSAETRPL